jgi:hypothetical protein
MGMLIYQKVLELERFQGSSWHNLFQTKSTNPKFEFVVSENCAHKEHSGTKQQLRHKLVLAQYVTSFPVLRVRSILTFSQTC